MLRKILISMITILLIVPTAYAVWYNPFDWFVQDVSAQEEIKEVITWQDNCRFRCVDGKCNGILGQTFYVNEEGGCVEREKAKSLKGTKFYLEIDEDKNFPVTCSEWNWTSRTCEFRLDKLSLLNVNIPIKIGWINKTEDKDGKLIKEFIKTKSQNVKFSSVLEKKNIPINVAHNEIIKYGGGSTTIKLQDADTENLDDAEIIAAGFADYNMGASTRLMIRSDSTTARVYIKFNISVIPSGQIIDEAKLFLYKYARSGTPKFYVVHHVFNNTWIEGTLSFGDCSTPVDCGFGITWNNQPCGTAFDNSVQCNLTFETNISAKGDTTSIWLNWTVTNMVKTDYNDGNLNVSIIIKDDSEDDSTTAFSEHRSKEYTTDTTLRPYLNITYSELLVPPTVPILNKPDNDTEFEIIPELNWSNSTDPQGDAIFYYLEVDDNLDFSSPEYVNTSITETTNTTLDTPTRINAGINYWRVLATDNTANSSWSEIWQFNLIGNITISGETKSPTTIYSYTDVIVNATVIILDTTLDTTWLSSDYTGSRVNYTVDLNDTDVWYYTINSNNFSDGQVVNWIYYANSTAGTIESAGTAQSFTIGACQKWFVEDANDNYVFDVDMCTGEINIDGNITALKDINVSGFYYGNGSRLTDIVVAATGLDSAYDVGENTITVDSEDIIWNLTSTQDFIVQDAGRTILNVTNEGDLIFGEATGDQILAQRGSSTLPGYSFAVDSNTGMYSLATNYIYWSVGGSERMKLFINGLSIAIGGSRITPSLVLGNDIDTGMYSCGGDCLGFAAGQREFLRLDENGIDIVVFNEDSNDIDLRYETNTRTDFWSIDSGLNQFTIAGGYGSTGVTIYDDGNISMNGNLVIDGTCLSEGADCSADIAEKVHSKASYEATTCNTIPEHTETEIHNYYDYTTEECSYEWKGFWYENVCINITEKYEFNDISEICSDEYKEFEDGKYEKTTTCSNQSATWTEEETVTIPRTTNCNLDSNFNLEFESGDVVCIDETDPQHIKFCDKAYDTKVVSVVNYQATQIIGQRAPYPISIGGNIPVKVICNTPIQIGDLLVSSNVQGYAQSFKTWQPTATWSDMRKVWEHTGSPFAKALENCDSGSKIIRAWL